MAFPPKKFLPQNVASCVVSGLTRGDDGTPAFSSGVDLKALGIFGGADFSPRRNTAEVSATSDEFEDNAPTKTAFEFTLREVRLASGDSQLHDLFLLYPDGLRIQIKTLSPGGTAQYFAVAGTANASPWGIPDNEKSIASVTVITAGVGWYWGTNLTTANAYPS